MSSSTGLEMLPLLVGQPAKPEDMVPDVIETEEEPFVEDAEVEEIETEAVRASRTT
jgi:hypothetical protein